MSTFHHNYRSTIFWVSDVNDAAERLVYDSNAFHPANRKEFIKKVALKAVRILRDNTPEHRQGTQSGDSAGCGGDE